MKRLTFTERAVQDLRTIVRYTKNEWGTAQARRYRQELELSLDKLSLNPYLGRMRAELAPDVRSFIVAAHVVFYVVGDGGITVVRLLHSSMDIERVFNEPDDDKN